MVRHRVRVPLDRRGAGVGDHGLPADGPRDPTVDRVPSTSGSKSAARTLGGSRLWVFASITLPLALPGIITGTLLSFARGLGEFGATITFVSNIPGETQTLPLAIYTFTQVPGGDAQALRLSVIAVVLSIVALGDVRMAHRAHDASRKSDDRR